MKLFLFHSIIIYPWLINLEPRWFCGAQRTSTRGSASTGSGMRFSKSPTSFGGLALSSGESLHRRVQEASALEAKGECKLVTAGRVRYLRRVNRIAVLFWMAGDGHNVGR